MKKIAKTVGVLGLLGCAALSSTYAVADDGFWYIGGNIGQTRSQFDEARIRDQLAAAGRTMTSFSDEERATGFKLLGGYQFNKNFAVEGGYFDLGKLSYTASTVPAGTQHGTIQLNGLNIDAVGSLPISEKFSAFARLGLNYAQAKDNFSSSGAVATPTDPSPSKSSANYKYGVGVQYDLTTSLAMRAEAERYRIDDAVGNKGDVDMYSLGLVYRFREKKPAPAAKPAPVVAARERVIVPVVVYDQYCSILDIQFEINRETMQREEKEKLAVLGTYMKKYPNTTAIIEGHSDNVGTEADNMKLSQERAESVVQYLVNEHQIAPSRLSAVGYGETRPIADNSTEDGKEANRRIHAVIACVTDVAGLQVKAARVTMAVEIEFDAYKADIKPEYDVELRRVASYLKANPTVSATVEAHSGKFIGKKQETEEVSMEVSRQRAKAVVSYLVDKLGVPAAQVSSESFGQTRRVDYGTTKEGQQENRRVNIIMNYPKK